MESSYVSILPVPYTHIVLHSDEVQSSSIFPITNLPDLFAGHVPKSSSMPFMHVFGSGGVKNTSRSSAGGTSLFISTLRSMSLIFSMIL